MLNLNFTSFKNITFDEGKILYDFVLKNKIQSILEIGTYAGYCTIWLAKACEQNRGNVYTIDYRRNLNPDSSIMFKINKISNVFCKKVDGDFNILLGELKKIDKKFDLIIVDECHENISNLFTLIKNYCNDHSYIFFHDIMCKPSEYMKTPDFWNSINNINGFNIQKNEIATYDEKENINGFGILELTKVEEKKTPTEEKEVITKPTIQEKKEIEDMEEAIKEAKPIITQEIKNIEPIVQEEKTIINEKDSKEEKITQEKKNQKRKKSDT